MKLEYRLEVKFALREVLKRELENRNMSILKFAEEINIPQNTLRAWLDQSAAPSAKNIHYIKTIADYFKLSVATLLFNVPDEKYPGNQILFNSEFFDGATSTKYKIQVEKIKEK